MFDFLYIQNTGVLLFYDAFILHQQQILPSGHTTTNQKQETCAFRYIEEKRYAGGKLRQVLPFSMSCLQRLAHSVSC